MAPGRHPVRRPTRDSYDCSWEETLGDKPNFCQILLYSIVLPAETPSSVPTHSPPGPSPETFGLLLTRRLRPVPRVVSLPPYPSSDSTVTRDRKDSGTSQDNGRAAGPTRCDCPLGTESWYRGPETDHRGGPSSTGPVCPTTDVRTDQTGRDVPGRQ